MGPFGLLKKVVEAFELLQIQYLVTGSMASIAFGEPRLTNGIDIVAAIEGKHITGILNAFPSPEFYASEEAIKDALRHQRQFNIIHPSSGLKIDVILKKDTQFDHSRFNRIRRIKPAESYQSDFASPEDVIIKKMEYYKEGSSEKHLRDITGIVKISGDILDYQYIAEWAKRLGLTEIWEAIQRRLQEKS
jgi:hypothetical protein